MECSLFNLAVKELKTVSRFVGDTHPLNQTEIITEIYLSDVDVRWRNIIEKHVTVHITEGIDQSSRDKMKAMYQESMALYVATKSQLRDRLKAIRSVPTNTMSSQRLSQLASTPSVTVFADHSNLTPIQQKRHMINNQLNTLLNLPPITEENSNAIQEMRSTVNDCRAALRNAGVDVDKWDPIIIYLCSSKLPHQTLVLFELSLHSLEDTPTWSQMDKFLADRFEVIERLLKLEIS